MVDSPFQTFDTLAEDFLFLRELKPHMIGIGPFIPQKDTRFRGYGTPTADRTLILLSLIRIMLPKTLLPATTALSTVDPLGREKGFEAGANVVMPKSFAQGTPRGLCLIRQQDMYRRRGRGVYILPLRED